MITVQFLLHRRRVVTHSCRQLFNQIRRILRLNNMVYSYLLLRWGTCTKKVNNELHDHMPRLSPRRAHLDTLASQDLNHTNIMKKNVTRKKSFVCYRYTRLVITSCYRHQLLWSDILDTSNDNETIFVRMHHENNASKVTCIMQ